MDTFLGEVQHEAAVTTVPSPMNRRDSMESTSVLLHILWPKELLSESLGLTTGLHPRAHSATTEDGRADKSSPLD
jgi:hypothetical protein